VAEFNWRYSSPEGKQYIIGLFHGPNTGHFMVHCNGQVILIDFNVMAPRSYTFFIEDELCEIKLDEKAGQPTYDFEINPEVDTRPNRIRNARRSDERKEVQRAKWIGLVFFLVVFFLSVLLFYIRRKQMGE
jgi:hypothetical protein